jgi:Zn-finger nucleic acid-binding protein
MPAIDCPKCRRPLSPWSAKGVTLDHCASCKGLWFDRAELSQHFANLGTRVSEADLERHHETQLLCPRCEDVRLLEATLDQVSVETCPSCHGIFLDLGEVHEIVGALHRAEYARDPATAGFDDFALGLYIGSQLGRR